MRQLQLHWSNGELSAYEMPLVRIGRAWYSKPERLASAIGSLEHGRKEVSPLEPGSFQRCIEAQVLSSKPCSSCGIRPKILFLHPENLTQLPDLLLDQVLLAPVQERPCDTALGLLMRRTPVGEIAFAYHEVRSIESLIKALLHNSRESDHQTANGIRLAEHFVSRDDQILLALWSTAVGRFGEGFHRKLSMRYRVDVNRTLQATLSYAAKSLLGEAIASRTPKERYAWPARQRRVREIQIFKELLVLAENHEKVLAQAYALIRSTNC